MIWISDGFPVTDLILNFPPHRARGKKRRKKQNGSWSGTRSFFFLGFLPSLFLSDFAPKIAIKISKNFEIRPEVNTRSFILGKGNSSPPFSVPRSYWYFIVLIPSEHSWPVHSSHFLNAQSQNMVWMNLEENMPKDIWLSGSRKNQFGSFLFQQDFRFYRNQIPGLAWPISSSHGLCCFLG